MPRHDGNIRLLSPEEITRREKDATCQLKKAFKRPKLQLWRGHLDIGLRRIAEKGAMARTIARHMAKRKIATLPDLAAKLFFDPADETLSYVCLPAAFRSPRNLSYLIALCDLEWDKKSRSYRPLGYTRLE